MKRRLQAFRARPLDRTVARLDLARKPPDEKAQPPHPEADVQLLQQAHIAAAVRARPGRLLVLEGTPRGRRLLHRRPQPRRIRRPQLGRPRQDARRLVQHGPHLQLRIGRKGKSRLPRRLGLDARPRLRQPLRRHRQQEKALPHRPQDRFVNRRRHRVRHSLQPPDPRRHVIDPLQAVADRLLARDIRHRAEHGGEEPRLPLRHRVRHIPQPRLGVDIDEPPVHLPVRRPQPHRLDRRPERRIVQHAAVNQDHILRRPVAGQLRLHEPLPSSPGLAPRLHPPIDLVDRRRRKRPRKARGRPRRQQQLRPRRNRPARRQLALPRRSMPPRHRRRGKTEQPPMLALRHRLGRMDRQFRLHPPIIRDGHIEVQGQRRRDQRPRARPRRHRIHRLVQHHAQHVARKGRLEPAAPHELRQLQRHLRPHLGHIHARKALRLPRRKPGHRLLVHLLQPLAQRVALRLRVQQMLHIRLVQPHVRQGLQRLPQRDRIAQQHRIDPARRGACQYVHDHRKIGRLADRIQHRLPHRLAVALSPLLLLACLTRPQKLPQLLRHPVHVDGKAHPAIAHQRQPKLLLPDHRPAAVLRIRRALGQAAGAHPQTRGCW